MKTIQKCEMQNTADQTVSVTGLMIGGALVGVKNQALGIETQEDKIYLVVLVDTDQQPQEWNIKLRGIGDNCEDVQATDSLGLINTPDGLKAVFAERLIS